MSKTSMARVKIIARARVLTILKIEKGKSYGLFQSYETLYPLLKATSREWHVPECQMRQI